ncbi:MAG: hypothetical protein ACRDGF_04130 [Chloroflexota bacterium]
MTPRVRVYTYNNRRFRVLTGGREQRASRCSLWAELLLPLLVVALVLGTMLLGWLVVR